MNLELFFIKFYFYTGSYFLYLNKIEWRMNKFFLILIVGAFMFLFSCGDADNSLKKEVDSPYGGTLRLSERRGYETLNPMMIQNIASFQIASQIYENLLRFDEKDLSLQPSIAESWKVDDAGLVYTFKIKKGVYFHDDECFEDSKGRELTAHDVEYSFKRICLTPKSYAYRLFNKKVVGVKEFSLLKTSEKGSIEGIKVIDDNTIQITLIKPSSNFLYSMAQLNTAIISKEAVDKYGNKATIGTGPFKYVSAADSDEKTVLVRNENYHLSDKEGNKLPYLDTVVFYYINEGKEQMKKFEKGELDVVSEIPPLAIAELVQNQIEDFQSPPVKYVLENSTTLLVNYLELNTVRKPFNNIKVRQAFAMAIDKTKIVDEILKGSAFAPGNQIGRAHV